MEILTEALPFSVVAVSSEIAINSIAEQRYIQYRRHYGDFALSLQTPESDDTHPDAILVAAVSTQDSRILGSFRLEKDTLADTKISIIENFGKLNITGKSALVSRLVVSKTSERIRVRNALFKYLHRYCFSNQIQNILVAAKPPLDRLYQKLGFKSAIESDHLIPIEWSGHHMTKILYLDTVEAVVDWHNNRHDLYNFMANTFHPNIKVNR
jgi:hypothetical protein